jgi:hypothetical protein
VPNNENCILEKSSIKDTNIQVINDAIATKALNFLNSSQACIYMLTGFLTDFIRLIKPKTTVEITKILRVVKSAQYNPGK